MTEWVIYWHLYQYQYLTPNHSKYLFSYLKTDADPKKKKKSILKICFHYKQLRIGDVGFPPQFSVWVVY